MTTPPIKMAATFQGGLRGDLNASIDVGNLPSDSSNPPGLMFLFGNPDLWRIVEVVVKWLLGPFMRLRFYTALSPNR